MYNSYYQPTSALRLTHPLVPPWPNTIKMGSARTTQEYKIHVTWVAEQYKINKKYDYRICCVFVPDSYDMFWSEQN